MEIEAAGFGVDPHRTVSETVSGSKVVAQRKGLSGSATRQRRATFSSSPSSISWGRDAIDVSGTVPDLEKLSCEFLPPRTRKPPKVGGRKGSDQEADDRDGKADHRGHG